MFINGICNGLESSDFSENSDFSEISENSEISDYSDFSEISDSPDPPVAGMGLVNCSATRA
jgi:hypothetical protein